MAEETQADPTAPETDFGSRMTFLNEETGLEREMTRPKYRGSTTDSADLEPRALSVLCC